MTISFSKPVTNPVVSFAGWGGGSNGAGWSEMQLLGGMNGSSSVPGARFTALSGTNIEVSQNGTVVMGLAYVNDGYTIDSELVNANDGDSNFKYIGPDAVRKFKINTITKVISVD